EVAPGLRHLGVMLPYTPLHMLLFEEGPDVMVMTSGNPTGLPLCTDENEARERLNHIADAFLIHNRPIHVPCDDSVMQVADDEPFFHRRSRGFVPAPVRVSTVGPAVLGAGGDMKNAFCLVQGQRAVFSQHLGDMETEEGRAGFRRALDHLTRLAGIAPALVAYDLHPGYHSSALARELPGIEAHTGVQHHHAHMAACMAENGLADRTIGLVLDGTGYGHDGAIWGFEVLAGGLDEVQRIAHLAYSPLPGGEAAIRRPIMAATGLVGAHLGGNGLARLRAVVRGGADVNEAMFTAARLMGAKLNSPEVGSAGRLFDAVSAMLGICQRQTYEGQAAIELGAVAAPVVGPAYPVGLDGDRYQVGSLLDGILGDLEKKVSPDRIAGRFLATVVEMVTVGARRAREQTGFTTVCLSGGTFQSAFLLQRVTDRLTEDGFRVCRHREVPPGDGGLALGQAMVALRRWQRTCV
ncbi:MAG TPA: Sua5/YciO/YrdC/YwlC family protein, partial [Symbiobacteriaceae bacterium]|nr:Sua5/YciO/YrdC/YwlC family protein [Symbiobacteriaceae bacterium]